MSFLSLKEVLVGCLEAVLFSACEDNPLYFMLSSQKTGIQKPFCRQITLKHRVHWRSIPIEKKQTADRLLYTSALPHIVAREASAFEQATLAEVSGRLVNQLNQASFQQLNSDLDHDNDLLFFVCQLWSEFQIETRKPGWLALQLSNQGIDLWIQHHQKVFQTHPKHTQLFLNYGCLRQMSYTLFKSIDKTDRDHNSPIVSPPHQAHHQRPLSPDLNDSIKQSSTENDIPKQDFPRPSASDHTSFHQKSKTQLIPTELRSHRYVSSSKPCDQQALSHKHKQLADHWLWQVQYTYARCCSVIQRWETIKAGMPMGPSLHPGFVPAASTLQPPKPAVSIDTSPKRGSQPTSRISASGWPNPSDSKAGETYLARQQQAQELIKKQLIASLIEATDNLFWIPYRWPSQQYFLLLKSSGKLCQAFEAFSSHCLVGFGQGLHADGSKNGLGVIASKQAHVSTQIDLVIATQNILKVLLEVHLEEPAPTEL